MHPRPTNGVNTDYAIRTGNLIDAVDRRLKGNLLDNAAFQVWDNGTSFPSAAAAVFGPSRWAFYRAGFALGATLSQQTGSQAQYCARVQRDNLNASTAGIQIVQSMESANSIPLRSRPVAIAFRARMGALYSSASAALTVAVLSGTGTDQSFPATGFTGQSTVTSTTVTLTTSWQSFTVAAASPGASITQLAAFFGYTPVGTAGATDYFEIEEIQMVFGDYTGEFPYKTLAEEWLSARRYRRVEAFRIPAATAVSERIAMRGVPTITGGGAGYTSTGTTADAIVHFQTAGAVATLTLDANI